MTSETKKVGIRIIAFNRKSESVAMEVTIAPVELLELRRLAGLPEDLDAAVRGIDLTEQHLPTIDKWIRQALDLHKYNIMFDEILMPYDYDP